MSQRNVKIGYVLIDIIRKRLDEFSEALIYSASSFGGMPNQIGRYTNRLVYKDLYTKEIQFILVQIHQVVQVHRNDQKLKEALGVPL